MNARALLLAAVLLAGQGAVAGDPQASRDSARKPGAQAPATSFSEGVVRSVDRAGGTITLKHGDIPSLHMGPMTMVFGVKSPALLEGLSAGDKVRFRAEAAKDDYVVTAIERVK